MSLAGEKLAQAAALVDSSSFDAWLIFVRETSETADPLLQLLTEASFTWQTALILGKKGKRIAVAGTYDMPALEASGDWPTRIPYDLDIREPLLKALDAVCGPKPRIAVNFSVSDPKADGLTAGMLLLVKRYLKGTRFSGALASAEPLAIALRSGKTPAEIEAMRQAIAVTDKLFASIAAFARIGRSEKQIQDHVQSRIDRLGLGYAWHRSQDPIVNSGPNSAVGHGVASDRISLQPGHVFHVDLGIIQAGYASDIQRCWYVAAPGETAIPEDVAHAFAAVRGAILAGAAKLKPGAQGWKVDQAARSFLVGQGYPEYMHAFGHQVGRVAHDGGAILGPRWARYGKTPTMRIEKDQVFTLELGVSIPNRGYLGLEEMAVVTESGCEMLSKPQTKLPILKA